MQFVSYRRHNLVSSKLAARYATFLAHASAVVAAAHLICVPEAHEQGASIAWRASGTKSPVQI